MKMKVWMLCEYNVNWSYEKKVKKRAEGTGTK